MDRAEEALQTLHNLHDAGYIPPVPVKGGDTYKPLRNMDRMYAEYGDKDWTEIIALIPVAQVTGDTPGTKEVKLLCADGDIEQLKDMLIVHPDIAASVGTICEDVLWNIRSSVGEGSEAERVMGGLRGFCQHILEKPWDIMHKHGVLDTGEVLDTVYLEHGIMDKSRNVMDANKYEQITGGLIRMETLCMAEECLLATDLYKTVGLYPSEGIIPKLRYVYQKAGTNWDEFMDTMRDVNRSCPGIVPPVYLDMVSEAFQKSLALNGYPETMDDLEYFTGMLWDLFPEEEDGCRPRCHLDKTGKMELVIPSDGHSGFTIAAAPDGSLDIQIVLYGAADNPPRMATSTLSVRGWTDGTEELPPEAQALQKDLIRCAQFLDIMPEDPAGKSDWLFQAEWDIGPLPEKAVLEEEIQWMDGECEPKPQIRDNMER
jgi:hypothetical protein